MYLLLMLLIFALIGYLLAESRVGKRIDGAAVDASRSSRKWFGNTADRMRSVIGIKSLHDKFDVWVNTIGISVLPSDFKNWYASLAKDEAKEFTHALSAHLKSLKFDLRKLVDGSIDQDPMLRQVFVETIVVYSQEFRKAKQAHKEDDREEDETSDNGNEDKKMAEKRTSRRKSRSNNDIDVYESASPA